LVRLIAENQMSLPPRSGTNAVNNPRPRGKFSISKMRLFLRCEGTRPIHERFCHQGNGAFLLVMRMPSRTIAGLSLIFCAASVVLLFASAAGQQSRKPVIPIHSNYSQGDVRLLNAEEINSRTLALVAAIDASSK
jgi:hypothetical protein